MPRSRFQFPLDPVLRVRERSVDAAREALGRAVLARAAAEVTADRAAAAFVDALGTVAHRTAAALGGQAAHRDRLRRAALAAYADAERARTEEAEARAALADALRGHRAIEDLRDEAAAEHRADALRAETDALDEIGALRASAPRAL